MRLIQTASRPLIDAMREAATSSANSDGAAEQLRADLERWSRWALGIAAYLLSVTGGFVGFGMIEAIRALGGTPQPVDVVVVLGAVVLFLSGTITLAALWWTGRRLGTAAARWLRSPYSSGGRQRRAGGWLAARTVNFEPRIFARIITGTIAILVGLAGLALLIRDLSAGTTALTGAAAAVAVISLASGIGQLGGVLRLVAALGNADPLWWRIRSAFTRRESS